MELTNEFVIDRPVDETWRILNDLEFIAPCMPGAQLQEIEGDEYRGIVKIKVGPISAQYKGKASFIEQNEVDKTAKLKAEGRDPRQGNANAFVTAKMVPSGDNATTVEIHTDLSLSGKVASFGRGAIEDVSKKILGQFTENLRVKLEEGGAPGGSPAVTPAPAAAPAAAATPAAEPAASAPAGAANGAAATTAGASTAAAATSEAPSEPTIRKIDAPEPEPVDLIAVTGNSIGKRLAPIIGVAVLAFILRWFLSGRGAD